VASLLQAAGCPACRYGDESADTYLSWFALEGYGDVDMLRRLRASLGMCARHTRRLFAQPGAAARLTMVYRHVLAGVLAEPGRPPATCPACAHDAAAEERVTEILLDDLAAGDRRSYKEHGGLCLPHLRRAAVGRGGGDVRWLIRLVVGRLAAEPDLSLLSGWPDRDVAARAALRARPAKDAAAHRGPGQWFCPVCRAAAHAEHAWLAQAALKLAGQPADLAPACLCAGHLTDLALASNSHHNPVVAWQAGQQADRLTQVIDGHPRPLGLSASWLSPRARRALADPDCPACRSGSQATTHALDRLTAALHLGNSAGSDTTAFPCLKHLAQLRESHARAALAATTSLRDYAQDVLTDLADAAPQAAVPQTPVPQPGPPDAWQRAAALLDGGVTGGWPAESALVGQMVAAMNGLGR
jgi:hypothetical protein